MAKTLTEMVADIVAAQAGVARMSAEEMSEALTKAYESLKRIKSLEEGMVSEAVAIGAVAVPMEPKASIQRNRIICLECGKEFKQISKAHLRSHGLTPKEYKKKYSLPLRQALTAKSLTAKRRKLAKEKQLGNKLAEYRMKKAAQKNP